MKHFQPVVLGGDIGTYALARELNDAYNVRPILISAFDTLPIRDSRIVFHELFENANDVPALIDKLLEIGKKLKSKNPDLPLLVLANADWRIQALSDHRDELEEFYIVPIPSAQTIAQVSDKQGFAEIAKQCSMPVPASFYVDFSDADSPDFVAPLPPDDFPFPAICKAAKSSDYENLKFEGKQKVYLVQTREEMKSLWNRLRDAGFRGTFIVQELIAGDDSCMYSVTSYVDSRGELSLNCSAHVLLQDHHPTALGNPCSMVTEPFEELLDAARRFLGAVDYHGFANFDIKRDKNTGAFSFFEVNPRIGRNSFYVVGAGVNPMRHLVEDVVFNSPLPPVVAKKRSLYSVLPFALLSRYLPDEETRKDVRYLNKHSRVNPLDNPRDNSLRRRAYRYAQELNQFRKFHKYYPEPNDSGI